MNLRLIVIFLTIFFSAIGLVLHWYNTSSDTNQYFHSDKDLLFRKDSITILLQRDNITILRTEDSVLYINQDKLLFTKETILGKSIYVPSKRNVWEGYLKLWFISDDNDSLKSKVQSIQKIKNFCRIPDKKIADSLLFDLFIRQLQNNQKVSFTTIIVNNELISQRIQTLVLSSKEILKLTIDKSLDDPLERFYATFFLLVSVLLPLLFLCFYKSPQEDNQILNEIVASRNTSKTDLQQVDDESLSTDEILQYQKLKSQNAHIQLYMNKFYSQYHDFYDSIQKLATQPKKEDKQLIKRKLVEMGLHAHTWMMVYKLQKIDRLQEEPNVALIINDGRVEEVDKQIYIDFTEDPYITPQRIRFLKKIIEEIDIGDNLNAFLNNVYVSKENW